MAFPTAPTEDVVEQVIQTDLGTPDSALRTFMDARYYNVFNIRRNDDVTTIQAALNAASAVGQEVPVLFPKGGTLYLPSTVTVPGGVRLLLNGCTLITDQNIPVLTLAGDHIRIRDGQVQGSMPDMSNGDANMANQMGMYYNGGATFNPIIDLDVADTQFANFYGIGAQIVHGRRIKFRRNTFDQYCRGGLWYTSVIDGDVDNNYFYGMNDLYLGTNFCYAFTATVSISTSGTNAGLITDTINPRSENIDVTHNKAYNQSWECFDTHLGKSILFQGNRSKGNGAVVAAVGNSNALAYSPLDISIIGNVQNANNITEASNGGISLMGSQDYLNPNRELATGVITGNTVEGACTDGQTNTGAINVSNAIGVPITSNVLRACKSIGMYLRNAYESEVGHNSIVDLWRTTSPGPTAYYLISDDTSRVYQIHSSDNSIVRGNLSKPYVNTLSYGGTSNANVQVLHSNDYLNGAQPTGAAGVQNHIYRLGLGTFANELLGFYGSNGGTKPLSPGSATLSNVDQVVNNLTASLRTLGLIN